MKQFIVFHKGRWRRRRLCPVRSFRFELPKRSLNWRVELARSGQGIAVIAGWALDDIGESEGLAAVRITKHGFKRSWRAVVGTDRNEEHIESFLKHVRATGAAVQNRAWRKKLRAGHPQ